MTDPMEFSRHFRELIVGERQADVARKLGYVQSRVSQVARGERPSRDFVERLVEVYELDRETWLQYAGFAPRPPVEAEEERLRRIIGEELDRRRPDVDRRREVLIRRFDEVMARRAAEGKPTWEGFHLHNDEPPPVEMIDQYLDAVVAALDRAEQRRSAYKQPQGGEPSEDSNV